MQVVSFFGKSGEIRTRAWKSPLRTRHVARRRGAPSHHVSSKFPERVCMSPAPISKSPTSDYAQFNFTWNNWTLLPSNGHGLTSILTTTTKIAATTVPKKDTEEVSRPSLDISFLKAPYGTKNIAKDVRVPYSKLRKKIFLLNSWFDWPGIYKRGYLEQPFSETSLKENNTKPYY